MAICRAFSVYEYILIAFTLSTISPRSILGSSHQETISCHHYPTTKPGEACDTATNCRFGGNCQKAADVSDRGTITRHIMPDVDEDSELSSGLDFRGLRNTGSRRTEVCSCHFRCEQRLRREVCGSNDITYSSKCHLRRHSCRCQYNITVAHTGPCAGDTLMEKYRPVTPNAPMRDCPRTCQYGGMCDSANRCQCDIQCPRTKEYVCGGDGKTYLNRCYLRRVQCEQQRGINIVRDGPCRSSRKKRMGVHPCKHCQATDSQRDPVCGSDGVTYQSVCLLKRASCIKGQQIVITGKGYCGEQDSDLPKPTPDPCRGIDCTHGGVCIPDAEKEFDCSCARKDICSEDEQQNENTVRLSIVASPRGRSKWVDDKGPRRNRRKGRKGRKGRENRRRRTKRSIDGDTAPRNVTLCGSDGKTYRNLCEMRIHGCLTQTEIRIMHVNEPCPMKHPNEKEEAPREDSEADVEEIFTDGIDEVTVTERQGFRHTGLESKRREPLAKERRRVVHRDDVAPKTVSFAHLASTVAPTDNTDHKVNVMASSTSQPMQVSKRPRTTDKSTTRGTTSDAIVKHTERLMSTESPLRTITRLAVHYETETNGPLAGSEENKSRALSVNDKSEEVEPLVEAEIDVKSMERQHEKLQRLRTMWMKQHTGSPVVCTSAGPYLQWYHVVLISLATQIVVVLILCGLYFGMKRRRLFKHNDEIPEDSTAADKSEGNVSDKGEGNKT